MAAGLAAKSTKPAIHYDTIVIGAGMAGLACASRLYEHARYRRPKNLLVLEARERIGGRVNSVFIDGCRLDTGANWIHGVGTSEKPNPLMSLLPHKRYKELSGTVVFRPPADDVDGPASTGRDVEDDWIDLAQTNVNTAPESDGDRVIPAEAAENMYGALRILIGLLHEAAESTPAKEAKHTTVLSAIQNTGMFGDELGDLPKEYQRAFRSMPSFIEVMEAAPLAAQSAEQSQKKADVGLLEYAIDDFEGAQVFLQDGYLAVINEVAKDLIRNGLIKTGVEVQQISWAKNLITITTDGQQYTARTIICTFPLGVLQHSLSKPISSLTHTPLFDPPLPKDKREAISSLGFGTLDKIFLTYSSPWWETEPYLKIIRPGIVRQPLNTSTQHWSDDQPPDFVMGFTTQLPGITLNADGTTSSGPRLLSVFNLNSIAGQPALCAFVACSNALHIESLPDSKARDLVHSELCNWYGRRVPSPTGVHVTRWHADPHSRGSYSHMIAGISENRHRDVIAKPLTNEHGAQIRFAGEHTGHDHFATVHAALLSGWREADALLAQ